MTNMDTNVNNTFLAKLTVPLSKDVYRNLLFRLPQYSGTSDSGPSAIGTQYNIPLYKGYRSRSQKFASLYM